MDFDYKSFSTRSFERFSQALSAEVLGNGLFVFGDGPDGGREASFEGPLEYPTRNKGWDGYTVMQAKFRQVQGSPADDANWLVGQLREELAKFLPPTNLRAPEYYILISNARLSPVPKSKKGMGGLAKIDAVFEEYASKIGIKDYRVWHNDQIATFLQNAPALRQTYAAWLCTSDVVSKLLEQISQRSEDITNTMFRYLSRELRSHQPLRLQQAGHSGDAQIMIEDVFVDLPFRQSNEVHPDDERKLLSALLDRSKDRLDPDSVSEQRKSSGGRPERILLLGGPGQGKSTLSQFLAQIARATMLVSKPPVAVSTEITHIAESTLQKAQSSELDVNIPLRFPLRIDLPNFADSMAEENSSSWSLIGYLCSHIERVAGSKIDRNDLRRWVKNYPTLLILDGLDEVPPSANRDAVIQAVNEFWDDAPDADLLMVITTRPQGYNDDLDPRLYSKLEMVPLSPVEANEYAAKLASHRLIDPIQRERVLARLAEASKNPTTARLMISPLQVAILLALIDQRGDAPSDRWSLFDKYFNVVLEREQGKAGPVGEAMRRWGTPITALHHKAGFVLHVDAETQGSSEAFLSSVELSRLIRCQLLDEGFEGDELEETAEQLQIASTERLVLIVQREEGQFSFEVRSLQEFMAAAYLMSGREIIVQKRLGAISNRSHWRHVFLIAASKCFAVTDCQHYRDTIVTLCQELNVGGEALDQFVRTGSQLALALLEDGLAYDQPKYRRLLILMAVQLAEAGPHAVSNSLTQYCAIEPDRTEAQLSALLGSAQATTRDGARLLLLNCASAGQKWANDKVMNVWPAEDPRSINIFKFPGKLKDGSPRVEHMREIIENSSPLGFYTAVRSRNHLDDPRWRRELSDTFPVTMQNEATRDLRFRLELDGADTPLSFRVVPIRIAKQLDQAFEQMPGSASWFPLRKLRSFCSSPSEETLAELIEVAANDLELFRSLPHIPWIVANLLQQLIGIEDPKRLVRKIREGAYGNAEAWSAAEERWIKNGIQDTDFSKWYSGEYFGADVGDVGFGSHSISVSSSEHGEAWREQLFEHAHACRGEPRANLIHTISFTLATNRPHTKIGEDDALLLLENPGTREEEFYLLDWLAFVNPRSLDDASFLQRLSEIGRAGCFSILGALPERSELLGKLAARAGEHDGLVPILAAFLARTPSLRISNVCSKTGLARLAKSNDTYIAACSQLLQVFAGQADFSSEVPLDLCAHKDRWKISDFLELFLEAQRQPIEDHIKISDEIAAGILMRLDADRGPYVKSMQAYADRRSSSVNDIECWKELELGDRLFEHFEHQGPV